MATWFARLTNTNINAANMWNAAPDGSGTALTWPPAVDDILVANNQIIRLNVSTTVAEIRSDTTGGATAGGQFQYNIAGVSLTANVLGDRISGAILRAIVASGAVNFVGSLNGGSGVGMLISTGSNPTVNITGNLSSGANQAIRLTGTTTAQVNITGDVTAGQIVCVEISSSGATAVNVTGNAVAGAAAAITNSQSGSVSVAGYAQASATQPAITNNAQGVVTVGETRSASNGRPAITGAFRYASATAAKTMPYTPDGQISMTVLDVAAIVPAESDVRKGLIYGDGAYAGTLPLGRSRTSMAGRF